MKKDYVRRVITFVVTVIVAGGAALAAVWLLEERILFHPSRDIFATPDVMRLRYEEVRIKSDDGETLAGWFVPADAPAATILFLHGNAGNISHRLDSVAALRDVGFSVFIIDYRGYGESSGAPTEEGLYRDARAAWAYLTGARGLPPERIVLYGESIGSAPALNLAAETVRSGSGGPGAIILEGAFTSGAEMGRRILPFLPLKWIARTRLDNLSAVRLVETPTLFIHGGRDEIVPIAMGRRLHEASAASKKRFHEVPGASHNTVWMTSAREVSEEVRDFTRSVLPAS